MLSQTLLLLALQATSADALERAPLAVSLERPPTLLTSVGVSSLTYLSGFSTATSLAIEAVAQHRLVGVCYGGAGLRMGLNPVLPEGFVRLVAAPTIGFWTPSAGLELGVTARAHFDDHSGVLGALRQAGERGLSPFYWAIAAAGLDFQVSEHYRVSALSLQLGAQAAPAGRFVRLNINLLSITRQW